MQVDIFKTFISQGIKTKIKITDCMIDFLPEESQENAKSIRLALMEATYGAMGEMLSGEQQNREIDKPLQTKINID